MSLRLPTAKQPYEWEVDSQYEDKYGDAEAAAALAPNFFHGDKDKVMYFDSEGPDMVAHFTPEVMFKFCDNMEMVPDESSEMPATSSSESVDDSSSAKFKGPAVSEGGIFVEIGERLKKRRIIVTLDLSAED
eukprot:s204_g6.t1